MWNWLSRIVFRRSKSRGVSENTSYDFEVKGVRIAKAASKGSFNFADGSWEVGTEKAVYEKNLDAAVVLGEEAASLTGGDCAMLIPRLSSLGL